MQLIFYSNPIARILTCLTDTNTIMFFGFILTEAEKLSMETLVHERTHRIQWLLTDAISGILTILASIVLVLTGHFEWWVLTIPLYAWYLIYCLEWFVRVVLCINMQKAYEEISWEVQADKITRIYLSEYFKTGKEPNLWHLYKQLILSF